MDGRILVNKVTCLQIVIARLDTGKLSQIIFRSTNENLEKMHQNYFLFGIFSSLRATISEIKYFKLRKTRNIKNKFNDV